MKSSTALWVKRENSSTVTSATDTELTPNCADEFLGRLKVADGELTTKQNYIMGSFTNYLLF